MRTTMGIEVTGGRRALIIASVAMCAVGLPSAARAVEPSTVLTVEQALARASASGPAAQLAQSGREVAAARAQQARAWENPTLSVEVENVLGRGPYRDFDAAETTVSLGGGRSARLRAARSDETAAEAGVALAALEMRRDLTVAYAEAVAADRLAGIARERAALGAGTRDAVAKRHAAGLESDLQRARVEVETAAMQAEARRAAAAALAHRRALAAHWREETVTAPLDESWFDAAPRPVGPVDASVADAVSVDAHPLLRVARARIEQAKALLESARGARYGGLEATAGTRRYKDSPDGDRAWVLGLAMPLPLWDRNEAGIAEARAALQAAELDAERATRDIASGRESARADLDAARLEVEALEASGVPSAAAAAQLSAQGYEAGRLSLLERLDAERAWVQAREQLVSARLRLRAAEARLAAYQASSTER
jgi:cobalt-zinc-cadmium efflux system outer membrane protein